MLQVSIESIPKICRTIGGIRSALFIVSEHPEVILPTINTGQSAEDIDYNGNESDVLFTVNFRPSSAVLQETKATDNPAGDYYVYAIEGFIRKRRKKAIDMVRALENRTVHCIVTDRNGETTLILNLRHDSEYSSGDTHGSPNGYTFRFRVNTPRNAPEFTWELPAFPTAVDPGDPDPDPEEQAELEVHREFMTSGNSVMPPDFQDAFLVFRDNIHVPKDKPTKGYTNNTGVGIILTEDIRSNNPDGGEWITILYKTT